MPAVILPEGTTIHVPGPPSSCHDWAGGMAAPSPRCLGSSWKGRWVSGGEGKLALPPILEGSCT